MSAQSNGSDGKPAPDGPMERMEDTFPRLVPEMAARIARYGVEETYSAGRYLYERGQRNVDFFFLLGGRVELFDHDEAGAPQVVTVIEERQFPGELYLFNGRKSFLNARAVEDTRVARVPHNDFRRLVSLEPDIGEIILRAFILRRVGVLRHQYGRVVVIGPAHGGDTIRLQRFLTRNAYPHRLVDTDRDVDAARYLTSFHVDNAQLPVVLVPGGRVISNPPEALLADELGLTEALDAAHVYDVAVVGAGPAGLAAAVYAASEGLNTIVIEALAPGGQAGSSSKIENYLGFPTGISGQALAGRAQVQAQKFGATLAISRAAVALDCSAQPYRLRLEHEQDIAARSIVVATGAKYRKLSVPNYDRYEGKGIYYAATAVEARLCTDKEVVLVGGGNSAGQAAMFLASGVGHVHILVRAAGLSSTMSDYLVERIKSSPKITLHDEPRSRRSMAKSGCAKSRGPIATPAPAKRTLSKICLR
jgi:thioredoxin reductase (NADPH)